MHLISGVNRRTAIITLLVLISLVIVVPAAHSYAGTFKDDDGSTQEPFIEAIALEGITKGCNPPTNDMYCPDRGLTREEMATMLVRALDLPSSSVDAFKDDNDSAHESAINAIAAAGITTGCNPPANDEFCPTGKLTRGQMAAFVARSFALPSAGGSDTFVDDDSSLFEADIERIAKAGITSGCNPPTNNQYCPDDPLTRGQMAVFLARAMDLTLEAPPIDDSGSGTDSDLQDGSASGSLNSSNDKWIEYSFQVSQAGTLELDLSWTNASADFNLFLRSPNGSWAEQATGNARPETITADVTAGSWGVGVKAKSGSSNYTVTADFASSGGSGGGGGGTGAAGINVWGPRWMAGTSTVSQARAVLDAQAFSLLIAHEQTYKGHINAMHAANPDVIVLTYVNAAYAESGKWQTYPDSWFATNQAGVKVKSTQFGNYVMDVSNANWWNNRADKCKNLTNDNGYDGCFLDLLGTGPLVSGQSNVTPYNFSTGANWTYAQWLAQTVKLANRVESRVPNAVIYGNGLGSGSRYFASPGATSALWGGLNGMMAEVFVRSAHDGVNSYRGESQWKQDVDMLVDAANRGKTIYVTAKLWVSATTTQKNKWHEYALGTFLLGADDKALFTFLPDQSKPTEDHSWWDNDIGTAQGSYFKTSEGLYQRNFSEGRVLVNPTGSSKTITIGSGFKDVWGNSVSSTVTLQAHTAKVLTKP